MRTARAAWVALAMVGGCAWDPTRVTSDRESTVPARRPSATQKRLPVFGPVVTQAVPPPPISGGTLAVSPSDPDLVVAADPDRDSVYFVRLGDAHVRTVALRGGDEPGRVAFDRSGRAHVVLRGAGEVAAIDVETSNLRRHA